VKRARSTYRLALRLALLSAQLLAFLAILMTPTAAYAVCEGDPPVPAAPTGPRPAEISTEDPFDPDSDATMAQVYGTVPQLWTYDNGCSPGSSFMPAAGAGTANLGFRLSGLWPAWTQGLLTAVIAPAGWAEPLDAPIAAATQAVADGVWTPWLVLSLLVVAILVMLRSRDGAIGTAISAVLWALVVLIGVSWLVRYPTESVQAMDNVVRTAVINIGNGFSPNANSTGSAEDQAVRAVEEQLDLVVRDVQYRSWLSSVFGNPDSGTAKKFGPDVYAATHFTWSEWERYSEDPTGEGESITEDKQDAFVELAEDLKREDPVAYDHFTGNDWAGRIGTAVAANIVMLIVCGFLLVAGFAALAAFVMVRLFVPIAPAAGAIFMIDLGRDYALAAIRRVVGLLVMGPGYFVAALVLLKFESALLNADLSWYLKYGFILLLAILAWRLLRPAGHLLRVRIPGLHLLTSYLASKKGIESAHEQQVVAQAKLEPAESGTERRDGLVAGAGSQSVLMADQGYPTQPGIFIERPAWSSPTRGQLPGSEPGPEPGPGPGPELLPEPFSEPSPRSTSGPTNELTPSHIPGHILGHILGPPSGQRSATTPRPTRSSAAVIGPVLTEPRVHESNLIYDDSGNKVFVPYTPPKEGAA
jgi:hypothetical protein